ncbi:hypothetical protein A2U01_0037172, partial [Trifolium medium]|nr:hypothetical protein [Trifolium medium]
MNIKKNIVKPQKPLKANINDYLYSDGYPTISEADSEERKKKASDGEPAKEAKKLKVDKKKGSGGLKIGASEIRSKKKHEKDASKDDSETESDEVTLAQKLKQRSGSSTETAKAFQKQLSK